MIDAPTLHVWSKHWPPLHADTKPHRVLPLQSSPSVGQGCPGSHADHRVSQVRLCEVPLQSPQGKQTLLGLRQVAFSAAILTTHDPRPLQRDKRQSLWSVPQGVPEVLSVCVHDPFAPHASAVHGL
jgi:hypothetical protein